MNNTNTEQKRTPTPWVENPSDYADALVLGADGQSVISLEDDGACGDPECCGSPTYRVHISAADLRFMLRACNAHEQLVAALENVLGFCGMNQGMEAQMAIDDARAALLAARGAT